VGSGFNGGGSGRDFDSRRLPVDGRASLPGLLPLAPAHLISDEVFLQARFAPSFIGRSQRFGRAARLFRTLAHLLMEDSHLLAGPANELGDLPEILLGLPCELSRVPRLFCSDPRGFLGLSERLDGCPGFFGNLTLLLIRSELGGLIGVLLRLLLATFFGYLTAFLGLLPLLLCCMGRFG
jgi:hypothetical protein